ncbi:MAG: hypothetical protein ABSA97_06705 [Verrucomicrobiia bacterium]
MNARFPNRFCGRARPTNDRATAAFSLIEVALAVAVIAIGLLAVIGLFPQGLQSARDAADNTLSATIVQNLFGQLRNGDFTINICTDPSDLGYPIHCASPVPLNLSIPNPTGILFYFDQEGLLTNGPAYYRVNLQWSQALSGNSDLMFVRATVVWPAYLSSAPINTNIFITEVARYNNP